MHIKLSKLALSAKAQTHVLKKKNYSWKAALKINLRRKGTALRQICGEMGLCRKGSRTEGLRQSGCVE